LDHLAGSWAIWLERVAKRDMMHSQKLALGSLLLLRTFVGGSYGSEFPDSSQTSALNFPFGASVALVLRGSFGNDGRQWCDMCKGDSDIMLREISIAAASIVEMICRPLLSHKNRVTVYATTPQGLDATALAAVTSILSKCDADATFEPYHSSGQADGFHHATAMVPHAFDLVIVSRHDLAFKKPIDFWPTDFFRLNFYHRCKAAAEHSISNCTNDQLYTVPGPLFDAFKIATRHCLFDGSSTTPAPVTSPLHPDMLPPDVNKRSLRRYKSAEEQAMEWTEHLEQEQQQMLNNGHGCWNFVAREVGAENMGLLLGNWLPTFNIREETPLGCLIPARNFRYAEGVDPHLNCSLFNVRPGEALGGWKYTLEI
jgi:hypothetical protein